MTEKSKTFLDRIREGKEPMQVASGIAAAALMSQMPGIAQGITAQFIEQGAQQGVPREDDQVRQVLAIQHCLYRILDGLRGTATGETSLVFHPLPLVSQVARIIDQVGDLVSVAEIQQRAPHLGIAEIQSAVQTLVDNGTLLEGRPQQLEGGRSTPRYQRPPRAASEG